MSTLNFKKTKITLISLFDDPYPISLRPLYAVLRNANYKVNIIVFKDRLSEGKFTVKEMKLLSLLIEYQRSDIVGISVTSGSFKAAKRISLQLKRDNKNYIIVWGGIHPTLVPEKCIRFCDIVCIGEGEGAILDLAEALSEHKDITKIKNLWIKYKDIVIRNDVRELIDINRLPILNPMDMFVINANKITKINIGFLRQPLHTISRGCNFECTFCNNANLKKLYCGKGEYVRPLSVENVIKNLKDFKTKAKAPLIFITFIDSTWQYLDKQSLIPFSKEYRKYINVPFFCGFHPVMIKEEIISILKNAGCAHIYMGIEAPTEYERREFKRFYTNEAVLKAARLIDKYNIKGSYSFIDNNPFRRNDYFEEKRRLISRLPLGSTIVNYNMMYFPKTELTQRALKKKISKQQVEGETQRSITSQWATAVSREDIVNLNL